MGKHQHNSLRLAVILLFITSIAGCSSSGTLRSDYDPGADFGAYQTWNFMEDAGPDYEGYESLFTQYMLEAIKNQRTPICSLILMLTFRTRPRSRRRPRHRR